MLALTEVEKFNHSAINLRAPSGRGPSDERARRWARAGAAASAAASDPLNSAPSQGRGKDQPAAAAA